ncbi:MAG: (2,3-dihydroxybenzoyl)adenylate synthase [Acidimicrobiales bacterium]
MPQVRPEPSGAIVSQLRIEGVVSWPAEVAERYRTEGYWRGATLGRLLHDASLRHGPIVALVDAAVRLTHEQLDQRVAALAARLLDLGLRRGDRMIVQLPNCWQFVVLTMACLRTGVVPVMALPAHRRIELTHLRDLADAATIAIPGSTVADGGAGFDYQALARELGFTRVLVVDGLIHTHNQDLTALCDPPTTALDFHDGCHPQDAAVFLLSGGTTGLPKLIVRTHDDYAYNAMAAAEVSGINHDSVYLVSLPAGHNFPLACPGILGTLLAGGRVVMVPSPEPVRCFATIAAEGVTHTAAVPAVAGRWMDHVTDPTNGYGRTQLASLQVLQVGGARLADELARRVRPVLGTQLQQVFGMAEGLLNYTRLDDPDDIVCGTQGRPLSPADEVRLVDDQDQDVPDGTVGSLLTRGPYTPRGYFRAPEHNERAFTADGWYRSGDLCRRVSGGYLIVEGRDKDMINRGGEKISAEEVENLIYALPAVRQVAAVAMADAALGERVCVYVALRPGATVTLEEIRESMQAAGVARFKLPEHLVVVEELLVTKVGKVDKKALREDLAARLADAGQ